MDGSSMKIVFNGREYSSVDQMPPNAREQYLALMKTLDANNNGIPDVFEKPGAPSSQSQVFVEETITYNGRQYRSRSELPREVQTMLERMQAMKPGEPETRIQIQTEVSSPEIPIRMGSVDLPGTVQTRRSGSLGVILFLVALVAALLWLWISGVRPGDIFR